MASLTLRDKIIYVTFLKIRGEALPELCSCVWFPKQCIVVAADVASVAKQATGGVFFLQ